MMVIKTVKRTGNGKGRHTESYPCQHVVVDESETGIRIELCGAGPLATKFIDIPGDADMVFQMDDGGNTQDSWRLKEPREVRSA
jgi:hypothetical protein